MRSTLRIAREGSRKVGKGHVERSQGTNGRVVNGLVLVAPLPLSFIWGSYLGQMNDSGRLETREGRCDHIVM